MLANPNRSNRLTGFTPASAGATLFQLGFHDRQYTARIGWR